jgi:hypothetical protein
MQTQTAGASTTDWLIAIKELKIEAYNETECLSRAQELKRPITESMFGANIKDAIRITKDWLSLHD